MIYDLQKASLWKRFSAFLFDAIISGVLIVGLILLLGWATGLYKQIDTYNEKRDYYAEKYNIDLEMTQEKMDAMTEQDKVDYDVRVDQANRAVMTDPVAVKALQMIAYLPMALSAISTLVVYTLMEFVVPLILKNGQTPGKKIFGLGVIRTNCVKASSFTLFVRMAFGKFVIETMVPIALVFMTLLEILNPIITLVVLLGIAILELVVYATTKTTRSCIHDLISDTAVVDLSTQLVFDTEQDLIDYKTRIHAEEASHSPY